MAKQNSNLNVKAASIGLREYLIFWYDDQYYADGIVERWYEDLRLAGFNIRRYTNISESETAKEAMS